MNAVQVEYPRSNLRAGRPTQFSRAQLLIRLLILMILSSVSGAIGWPGLIMYLAVPAVAAILISERGGKNFILEEAPTLARALSWLLSFYAYLGFLTDRFPLGRGDDPIQYEVKPSGEPSVYTAVLRIVYSIPAALFLWLLGVVAAFIWVFSAVCILLTQNYPRTLFEFQLSVLRCHGRFLAYHASLIDRYPPFLLNLGPDTSESRGGGSPMTSYR